MPRGFDVSTESPATVAEVHSAFRDADYWRDRLVEFGGDSIRLDSLVVEGDSVFVSTTQNLGNDVLPGLIAKAVPGDLRVHRAETWHLTDSGVLHGDVVMQTSGAPISGAATALVSPIPVGSVLRFTGTVHMKVPIIGGPIEKYISTRITQEIPGVQRFTTRWLTEGKPDANV